MIIRVDESYRHKRDRTEQQLFAVVEQIRRILLKHPFFHKTNQGHSHSILIRH